MRHEHDIRIDRNKLHPWLDYKLGLLLKECSKANIYLIITEGFRSVADQDKLYAKGRTAGGRVVTNAKGSSYSSQHQWGIAFDIAINDSKKVYDQATIKKVAKIAKSKKVGLSWGGDWNSFQDTPHFYLGKWGSTTQKLKSQYGTFDRFKKTWTKKVSGTKHGLNLWNKTHTRVILKKAKNGTKVDMMYTKTYPFGKFSKVKCYGKVGLMKSKYLRG